MSEFGTAVNVAAIAARHTEKLLGPLKFQVGDVVSVWIPEDNKAWGYKPWGYKPCPDGTICLVVGYSHLMCSTDLEKVQRSKPSGLVYSETYDGPEINPHWVRLVIAATGEEITEFCSRLKLEARPNT